MNESIEKTRKAEEEAAIAVLRRTRMGVLEAAMLAGEMARICRSSARRVRRGLQLMEEGLRAEERSVSFAQAVSAALEARQDRRPRTLVDLRYLTKRLMARCPGLASRSVRSIRAADCAAYLQQAFQTPRQRLKAHMALSGVFRTARQRGWCAENPMQHVDKPRISEKSISALTRREIARLIGAARAYKSGACLPAVALMLYAGLRPNEVARLRWADICLPQGYVTIQPRHSKTGGARRVSMSARLCSIMRRHEREAQAAICPRSWLLHWRALHRRSGFSPWQPDVLRHTFASHHLARYGSYERLQVEMGHRSAALLRTRYLSLISERPLFPAVRGAAPLAGG